MNKILERVLVILLLVLVLGGVVFVSLLFFDFDLLKTLLLAFFVCLGFFAANSENLYFKSNFLIALAFGLLLFFDDFSEYAFVVVFALLFMFLGKFKNNLRRVFSNEVVV